jgi:hypothetical protein
MVDTVNQNVRVDGGMNGFWIALIIVFALVFMAFMFRGKGAPTPEAPENHDHPRVPDGWEIMKDRDGRVIGIKPLRRI